MTTEEQDSSRKFANSIKDPEALKIAQTIFDMHQDNYSWAARQKQQEEEIVQKAVPPIDLSQIDPAEHHLHDHSQLFVPEHIARYIQGCTFPLGDNEQEMILTEMDKFHRTKPYTITMDLLMEKIGRTYLFIPEVAKYETGFYYLHQAKEIRNKMNETKSQKFIRTLNNLANDAHNTSINDAVDLDTIPRNEWPLHVGAFVKIPKDTPAFHPGDQTSIEAALDWMKEYFKMQGSEFYINSNLFTQEDSDFGISTGFFLQKIPNLSREQIIQSRVDELYGLWQKTAHADRPGYEKSDAETIIRNLKSGQLFSKLAKAMSIQEILGE